MQKCLVGGGLGAGSVLVVGIAMLTLYSWWTGTRVVHNVGVSLPSGWYLCAPVSPQAFLTRGTIVEVAPAAAMWPPGSGVPTASGEAMHWLKQVSVEPGETVCLLGNDVRVAGQVIATRPLYQRYALPVLEGCFTVEDDEVFVLGTAAHSWDSRYLGPLPRTIVLGRCAALWLWEDQ